MTPPRYTITRGRGPLPWTLARTVDGIRDVVGRYRAHAAAVAAMDRLSGGFVPVPLALREGRAYGHTLVVAEDPVVGRRRALKARRMAARRRARPVRVVPVWESMARPAMASTRAEFTLAAPGGDA